MQVVRRLLHLCGQLLYNGVGVAGQKRADLIQHGVVLCARNLARAGRTAFADMVHQAGTLPPCRRFFQILFAVAHRKMLPHNIHAVAQSDAGEEGAKIFGAVCLDAAHDFHPREILPVIDANIGEVLVVLEQDVVFRPELLDEVGFQRQRLGLVGGAQNFKIFDMRNHSQNLWRMVFVCLKILANPVFEGNGLADIDHLPGGVVHLIDTGGGGEELELFSNDLVHVRSSLITPASSNMRYSSGSGMPMTLK